MTLKQMALKSLSSTRILYVTPTQAHLKAGYQSGGVKANPMTASTIPVIKLKAHILALMHTSYEANPDCELHLRGDLTGAQA